MMVSEKDLKFFEPVWRRVMVLGMLAGWTTVEWWTGNGFWGTLTLASLIYCTWVFLMKYPRLAPAHLKK